jgi:hypothetical protein
MRRTPELTGRIVMTNAELVKLHNYRLDLWQTFLRDAPEILVKRAVTLPRSQYIVWDPENDEDGWMLAGNDPETLAKETVESLELEPNQ